MQWKTVKCLPSNIMHWAVFFFKTLYFIIIHLTFITVTHYKMYVHLLHFQELHVFTSHTLSLWWCRWSMLACTKQAIASSRFSYFRELFGKKDSWRTVCCGSEAVGGCFYVTGLKERGFLPFCFFVMQVRSVQTDEACCAGELKGLHQRPSSSPQRAHLWNGSENPLLPAQGYGDHQMKTQQPVTWGCRTSWKTFTPEQRRKAFCLGEAMGKLCKMICTPQSPYILWEMNFSLNHLSIQVPHLSLYA